VSKIAAALKGSSYQGVLNVAFDDKGLNQTPIKVGVVRKGQYTIVPSGS
jgi:branched-chain amino acid transport system substrate-binding protein